MKDGSKMGPQCYTSLEKMKDGEHLKKCNDLHQRWLSMTQNTSNTTLPI